MTAGQLFYIRREGAEAGPYDVVQMAGLLRRKIIDGDTPVRRQGQDDWKPFSWHPQFAVAREMPAGAASTRTDALDEEAGARAAGPLPLPSAETVMKIAAFFAAALLALGGAFLIAWLDPAMGQVVLVIGAGAFVVGQAMMLLKVLDADSRTMLSYYFIPGYDIYFVAANFWQIFPWLCLKYIGMAACFGALLGMSRHT